MISARKLYLLFSIVLLSFGAAANNAVSYTHLTLPTIYSV